MAITKKYLSKKLGELRGQHPYAGEICFFTDVENLPKIFGCGKLLCREEVERRGIAHQDCASKEVLANSHSWVHQYVRLYHAPGTPMLYRVEGIKRQPDGWPECPRPAYLVMDPVVVTLAGVRLSDGGMGSKYTTWAEASEAFFDALPFDRIYHRAAISKDPQAEAIYGFDPEAKRKFGNRLAEVMVPKELDVKYVRKVVFRSTAERDMAVDDCGGFPAGVEVVVDKKWFFADSRGRPYLDTFEKGPKGTFNVAHLAEGDHFVQVRRPKAGAVSASGIIFRNHKWSEWKTIEVAKLKDLKYPMPAPGFIRFFLNGHRVAEEPIT